jgi:hypothetical protein
MLSSVRNRTACIRAADAPSSSPSAPSLYEDAVIGVHAKARSCQLVAGQMGLPQPSTQKDLARCRPPRAERLILAALSART